MKEGDTLYFKNGDEKEAKGKIVGFVSNWPGFQTKTIELNEAGELREKDNYLIVADYAALRQYFGVTPYQVWITVKEGESTDFFYQWMEENEESVNHIRIGTEILPMYLSIHFYRERTEYLP